MLIYALIKNFSCLMNRDLKIKLNKINQVFCNDASEHIAAKNTPEESSH
jgi:hypothetical protein